MKKKGSLGTVSDINPIRAIMSGIALHCPDAGRGV